MHSLFFSFVFRLLSASQDLVYFHGGVRFNWLQLKAWQVHRTVINVPTDMQSSIHLLNSSVGLEQLSSGRFEESRAGPLLGQFICEYRSKIWRKLTVNAAVNPMWKHFRLYAHECNSIYGNFSISDILYITPWFNCYFPFRMFSREKRQRNKEERYKLRANSHWFPETANGNCAISCAING